MLKRLIPLAAIAAFLALPASMAAQQTVGSVCKDGTTSNATGQGACSGHGGVDQAATKAAHKPKPKPKPAPPAPPAAPSSAPNAKVTCADGTTSNPGQGACSHHGGVAHANTAAPTAPPAAPPSGPNTQVTCADGTKSAGGQGACSRHGGIAKPNTAPAAAPPAPAPPAPSPAAAPNAPAGGSGESVNNNPQGAIAKCKDGTYSHAKQHSGACSKHGGVAQWLDGTTKQ